MLLGLGLEAEFVDVVYLTVFGLRGSPRFPAVGHIENVGVFSSFKSGFGRLVGLQGVEVFEKEGPRGLLRVVEPRKASPAE